MHPLHLLDSSEQPSAKGERIEKGAGELQSI